MESIKTQLETAKELLSRDWINACKAVIFGTGSYATETSAILDTYGIRTEYFCDNNPARQGTEINGKKILSPAHLHDKENIFVFVATFLHSGEIAAQLEQMNIPHIIADTFLFLLNFEKYQKVVPLLFDERSRTNYQACMDFLLTGNHSAYEECAEDEVYFSLKPFRFLTPGHDEVFLDVGAFVGDTLERFIELRMGSFKKIYAFEPGKKQFAALLKRTARLTEEWCLGEEQINCIQVGVGSKDRIALFSESENSPHGGRVLADNIAESAEEIQIRSLDSLIPADAKVDFIKADIEGSEMAMLLGAEQLIKRCRPKIAICIYHKALDYYQIPLLIKSFVPEYNMAVRHATRDRGDTVLLCWI